MTGKERVRLAMEGGAPHPPAVSPYITWPEYGWRLTGRPVWEVILGQLDGLEIMDSVLARHPQDFAGGPVGTMGTGWLDGKVLESQNGHHLPGLIIFRDLDSGTRTEIHTRSRLVNPPIDEGLFTKTTLESRRRLLRSEPPAPRRIHGE